jgi:hypothetical protein
MKVDTRLVTGILIGIVFGLQYHMALIEYMPLLVIASLILLLRFLHH